MAPQETDTTLSNPSRLATVAGFKAGDRVRHLGIRGSLRGVVLDVDDGKRGLDALGIPWQGGTRIRVRWPDRAFATWHPPEDLRVSS